MNLVDITIISWVSAHPVKASVYTQVILAFTGGACSGDYATSYLFCCKKSNLKVVFLAKVGKTRL